METRFILYRRRPAPAVVAGLRAARAVLKELGVTVVSTGAHGLLLQTSPAVVRKAARSLPGWTYTAETLTHRKPERPKLRERAVAAAK
jgi:hypothetical protein